MKPNLQYYYKTLNGPKADPVELNVNRVDHDPNVTFIDILKRTEDMLTEASTTQA